MSRVSLVVAAVLVSFPSFLFSQTTPPATDTLSAGGVVRRAALRRLPIDDPRHALPLVAGVTLRGGEIGIAESPGISIRGAASPPAFYLDGAPIRLQTFGVPGLGIDYHALDAVAVTSGAAPASLADAAGGVVSYTTRSGGDWLTGDVRWSSDEPFGDAASVGYNHITGTAGGPIGSRARFFVVAGLQGQRSQYRGIGAAGVPIFAPAGIDTVVTLSTGAAVTLPTFTAWDGGLRRPFDWTTTRQLVGRLDVRYGTGSTVTVTGLAGDLQQRLFPGQDIMDPAIYGGRRVTGGVGIVNWRHALAPATALQLNLSYAREGAMSGPLDPETEVATRDPYLGISFSSLKFTGDGILPGIDEVVRNVRTNSGLRTPYLNREDLRLAQPHRLNPYGMATSWPTSGVDRALTFIRERRLNVRGSVERRTGNHAVTAGLDFARVSVALYTSSLLRQAFMDVFSEQPSRVGAFVSDRLNIGEGGVLEVGVRIDRYAPGGELPKVPGRIYSNPDWSFNASTSDTAYRNSVARVFSPVKTQTFLSPRLRFAIPVAPRASVRLGYSRVVEPPAWADFYRGANSDLDFTNTRDLFGRDVPFAVASLIDVGARLDVGPALMVEASLFRRESSIYVGRILPYADPLNSGDTVNIFSFATVPDATQWGIETKLDWQGNRWLSGFAVYALGRRTIGSGDPFTSQLIAAAAIAELPAGSLNAVVMMRAMSGAPYTRLLNNGTGTITPGINGFAAEPVNASRLPWTKVLDLRIGKTVRAGGRDWEVFVDARNVLNVRNVRALFAETGDVTNDVFRDQRLASEFANLTGEAANNGALQAGNTIDLTACGSWADPVNCVTLTRVERRFGDGNGLYTVAEQQAALNAFYQSVYGPSRFYNAGRTLRVGAELAL